MQKPLWSCGKNNFTILLIVTMVTSCTLDQDKSISVEDIDFETRDDTEIFFKNIRQSAYHLEENKPVSINMFRLKAYVLDSNSREPHPVIIHHWLRDKAYIWLEFGGESSFDEPLEISIVYPEGEKRFQFDGSSPVNHAEIAIELFNASLTEATIFCEMSEILKLNSAERTRYQLVLNDYFRLLGLK